MYTRSHFISFHLFKKLRKLLKLDLSRCSVASLRITELCFPKSNMFRKVTLLNNIFAGILCAKTDLFEENKWKF